MSLNIAVMISGGGTNLQSIINAINSGYLKSSIEIVISDNEKAYGLERAKKESVETICLSKKNFDSIEIYEERLLKTLQEKKIDLIVLAGYLSIIPKTIIDNFKNKIINIHPSLIPSFCGKDYYGIKVHEEVLNRGVKVTGATTHFVDEGVDTGAIILQKAVNVLEGITAKKLAEEVLKVEHEILIDTIKLIEDEKITICERKVLLKEN